MAAFWCWHWRLRPPVGAATPDDCQCLRKHGQRAEAQACYESLTQARDPYLRAEGFWGLQNYQQANNEFRAGGGAVA